MRGRTTCFWLNKWKIYWGKKWPSQIEVTSIIYEYFQINYLKLDKEAYFFNNSANHVIASVVAINLTKEAIGSFNFRFAASPIKLAGYILISALHCSLWQKMAKCWHPEIKSNKKVCGECWEKGMTVRSYYLFSTAGLPDPIWSTTIYSTNKLRRVVGNTY